MAKRGGSKGESASDAMDLAAPVSERVQIQAVILSAFKADRSPDADTQSEHFGIDINVPKYGISKDEEGGILSIFLEFALRGFEGQPPAPDAPEAELPLSIAATFVLNYSLDSFADLTEENFRAFARLNGLFNAWPYWREFVQNATMRMGLFPVTVPVHRVLGPVR